VIGLPALFAFFWLVFLAPVFILGVLHSRRRGLEMSSRALTQRSIWLLIVVGALDAPATGYPLVLVVGLIAFVVHKLTLLKHLGRIE
jgi:hypothetical protein